MGKYSDKEWFVIFLGGRPLGIVRGSKKAVAEVKKYPGAICCGYASLTEALKALDRGPGYLGDVSPSLF